MVQADGAATNACGTTVSGKEDAQSVLVNDPVMQATKTVGAECSQGGSASGRVFAGVGDVLVWTVEVQNTGIVPVVGLLVTHTLPISGALPSWFVVTDTAPMTTGQSGYTLEWFIYTLTAYALPPLETRQLRYYWRRRCQRLYAAKGQSWCRVGGLCGGRRVHGQPLFGAGQCRDWNRRLRSTCRM